MQSLNSDEQYQQAFALGLDNLAEWEGDSAFDFALGTAAIESGNPNEAVFAFERVAATAGDSVLRQRARLELARAYFLTENLTAAENLFVAVLDTNPPANVRNNIQAFLELIDTRRDAQRATFTWSLASNIGSDDNVNSATSNGLIDTPLIGEIELNPDGQQTEDNFSSTTLGMVYRRPFTRDAFIGASVNLNHSDNFDSDQFDLDSLRSEVSWNWGSQTNRFRHGVTLSKVNLDGESFQQAVGLNSSWQRQGQNGWYQSLSGSFSQIRYDTGSNPQNDLRDVNQLLFTAGLTKITQDLTHSLTLYHADEDPRASGNGEHNGRRFTGLAYSTLYRFTPAHTPFFRISVQEVDHIDEHPVFFNDQRSDSNKSLTLGWTWRVMQNLNLLAETSWTDNESNIPLFEYTRFKYQAGFRYQF
ncbi:MAG: tetratricopeptide repeat protein [Pseudohongiellaceae bacterium]